MRSESRVGWALVEEELREQDERTRREQVDKPRQLPGKGGSRMPAAALRRGKAPRDLTVSIGEALQLELPARRDYDSTLLHRRLPLHFKRLKLDKFLMEGKDGEGVESAEAVGRELDAVFTNTNIQNKLEASVGRGSGKTSLAWEQRKMDQQAAQGRWHEHLAQHRVRVRMLKQGKWPTHEEPGQKHTQETDASAGLGTTPAWAAEGATRCPVSRELAKELNKIDRAHNSAMLSPATKPSESNHADLSAPARARMQASSGAVSAIPRPSQAWRSQVAADAEQSDAGVKCELDAILLGAGPQTAASSNARRRHVSEADVPVADAAATLRKVSWRRLLVSTHEALLLALDVVARAAACDGPCSPCSECRTCLPQPHLALLSDLQSWRACSDFLQLLSFLLLSDLHSFL